MTYWSNARELLDDASAHLARGARRLDDYNLGKGRQLETLWYCRVSKLAEETGEAMAALIGAMGDNPRKGISASVGDVRNELLDVAVTALIAYESLDGYRGRSMRDLLNHVEFVWRRGNVVDGEVTS